MYFTTTTLGCKVNLYETEALTSFLEDKGWKYTESEYADVCIINTCTVTSTSDQKSRQMIRQSRRKYPKAIIVAMGCFVQTHGTDACEIADIVLDNFGCVGDACITVEGVEGKICPTSTVTGALILNSIVAQAVDNCVKKGFCPDHFASSNVDGGDETNNKLVEKYKKEIKHL